MDIRLHKRSDNTALAGLWQQVFGDSWPLQAGLVQRALIEGDGVQPRAVLLAEEQGQPLGFVVVEYDVAASADARSGSLVALGVVPQVRRRGVGKRLHAAALEFLRAQGVKTVQLGGGSPRLWPGVPRSLPGALSFFAAQGWEVVEDSVDMLQYLGDYVTPPIRSSQASAPGFTVEVVQAGQLEAVLDFVAREFPEWLDAYQRIVGLGDSSDIVAASDASGAVVASLALYGPWSHPARLDIPWQALLGDALGGPGVVGVAAAHQRQGIGTLLMARANELLKQRGVENSLVCWTWAVTFYERLGYRVWQTYAMSWRTL